MVWIAFFTGGCLLALLLWGAVVLHPDRPYRYNDYLPSADGLGILPFISVVIPARNEEAVLRETLPTVLCQNYPSYEVILVDDHSDDQTQQIARQIAAEYPSIPLTIVAGEDLPDRDWVGKMWALHQGIEKANGEWLLLTDADIAHPPSMLKDLAHTASSRFCDMVSVMARLSTSSFWERLLIPAFLYFFKLLYPFSAVRDSRRKVAAAAGGCVFLRREALEKIDGIASIRHAIIDDIALACRLKSKDFAISLWDCPALESKRIYRRLAEIWKMVARTAFTELRYSYLRLIACIAAMLFAFALPVSGMFVAIAVPGKIPFAASILSLLAYALMCYSYLPTIRYFSLPRWYALSLPLAGLLYLAMTIDSARRYTVGVRASWRGRSYKS